MKLSIIVPVYNMTADGKLDFCIQSLLNQTIEDYEIIAVDDKSTDASLAVLEAWSEKFPEKIKVIASPENRRQGGAKNLGLAAAAGRWIGFMDSDDWAAPDMYEKLLNKAEQTGADIVGCDYTLVQEKTMIPGKYSRNNSLEQTGGWDIEKRKKMILDPGSMVIKIYRRDIFMKNGIRFPEHIFYEDNAIGAITMLYAERFEKVEEALYFYYQHSASTVHTISEERCRDRMKASEIYMEECRKRGFYEMYREEIDYKFFELYYRNTLFSYMQACKNKKLSFIREIKKGLLEQIPDFSANKYYLQYADAESKKLIQMHMKSDVYFYLYYTLLHLYRRVRYGK
ncbi:MAG: glycosyltransferase [Butyrivibrio sp.]|nr:glycosyltransferase [Acetatifactor muris]MCM1560076.1 glycosyltransferase [Butyrivibrio sp.]